MTKYAVIGALFALLFLLIYSRVRPYIEIFRKMLSVVIGTFDQTSGAASTQRSGSTKTENKLVRCVACGTWIPAERAIGGGPRISEYCSWGCFEGTATSAKRKAAG